MPLEEDNSSTGIAKAVIISVAVAVLIYAAAIGLTGYKEVSVAFYRINESTWFIILGLSLLSFIVRFLRWHFLLRQVGYRVPCFPGLAYYLAGFALTATPAKIGEAVRLWYLRRTLKISYAESAPIFIFEQVLDVLAVALLSFLAASVVLPSVDSKVFMAAVFLGLLLVPIILARADRMGSIVLVVLKRRGLTKFKSVEANSDTIVQSLHSLAPLPVFVPSLAVGLFAWLAPGLGLYLILRDMHIGVAVSAETAVGVFMLSLLAGVVSIVSGGVGTTEGALAVLLVVVGMDAPSALAAAIISRASTLWLAVGIGALSTIVIATAASYAPRRL